MEQNILELKKGLSEHELSVFNSEIEKYKKSTGLAYVLWWFLGTLGIHKFYIGKIKLGILYLVLGICAWVALIFGLTAGIGILLSETMDEEIPVVSAGETGMGAGIVIFIILISILGIMLLIDLFTIPKQIRKVYEEREAKILQKLKASE